MAFKFLQQSLHYC